MWHYVLRMVTICNTIIWVLNLTISCYIVIVSWSQLLITIPVPNVIPLCATTFMVPNVIIIIGLIQVTVSNAFPGSLLISPLCAHAVFERFTDRKWHNPSETSSDSQGDSLEQSCLNVGNSKTRRTLYQQLTIIYWNILV